MTARNSECVRIRLVFEDGRTTYATLRWRSAIKRAAGMILAEVRARYDYITQPFLLNGRKIEEDATDTLEAGDLLIVTVY